MPAVYIEDADSMVAIGSKLSPFLAGGDVLFLVGDLGAGKTTLARGILHGLGHQGRVKSPTYTLVEPYSFPELNLYHFDLYRINNAEELETMGLRDYLDAQSVCLFEWPERADEILPGADLTIAIAHANGGRALQFSAASTRGKTLLAAL